MDVRLVAVQEHRATAAERFVVHVGSKHEQPPGQYSLEQAFVGSSVKTVVALAWLRPARHMLFHSTLQTRIL